MITVVNYGMGNLGSIINMFKRLGVNVTLADSATQVRQAEKLILPGVGAFDAAMQRIQAIDGLVEVLNEKVLVNKTPILGICLGMQLLTRSSEEGQMKGFGWIDAETVKFSNTNSLKVPHMGWNTVYIVKPNPLFDGIIDQEQRYYFVHSYYVRCKFQENVCGITYYGGWFHSVIVHENIFGAQFHPEKSHKYGMKLFENFAKL